jgi:phosphoglycolate phosphatase-like HAD superfamily hydrolase
MGVSKFYEHYHLFEHITERAAARIHDEYVEAHWDKIVLRPDANKLFTACAHTRVPLIVMSSNQARVIERKLAECGASSCVRKIISTDDKETALAELAAEKKSSPESLLFVDDSSRDLAMAKRVGAAVAGFTKGYGSTRDIREVEPHFLVQSLKGVAKLVKNHE